MISTSLKPGTEIFVFPPSWFPEVVAWVNYADMLEETRFFEAAFNSIYVSVVTLFTTLIVSMPAAYFLSRYHFSHKGLYLGFLIFTQMISPVVLVIGIFRLMAYFNLVDSREALGVIYAAFGLAFCIWMLKNYFESVPFEIEQASFLEGSSKVKTFRKIFFPLALPSIAVSGMFSFVNSWNEFILALTLLRNNENYTITLKVFSLVGGRYTVDWNYVMGATLFASIPVAIIFSYLQKFLIGGLSVGSLK